MSEKERWRERIKRRKLTSNFIAKHLEKDVDLEGLGLYKIFQSIVFFII